MDLTMRVKENRAHVRCNGQAPREMPAGRYTV
jgi:hypothetical protein